MKKYRSAALFLVAALFVSGCASTFVASKDGKGYYLGNGSDAAYRLFCETGDLKKILLDSQLPQEMQNDLYNSNCGTDRSRDKVKQVYASMTPIQRKSLRVAFKHSGYDINIMRC